MDPEVTAIRADGDIVAKPAGLAGSDGGNGRELFCRNKVTFGIRIKGSIEDLLDTGAILHREPPFKSKGERVLRRVDLARVT